MADRRFFNERPAMLYPAPMFGKEGTPPDGRVSLPTVVAWTVAIAYLLAARGVRNFFPISSFDMYQGRAPEVASRPLVVDGAGRASELEQYDAFRCEPERPSLTDVAQCPGAPRGGIAYVSRDLQVYLDEHLAEPGAGAEEASIVQRSWTLEDRPGAPSHVDCVLARCTARRRGDAAR
jgi:hypothetical protein